ncbi:hypothetical protein FHS25_004096 [Rhizobium laguerreae]|uniref:Uncharacterized protein n=1 Tax=Rhizobium laguerreae TaxID=1076926 RepID=A0ABR6GBJ0_9HYPH|nr:hypothetical protein [Rhizobium laguerreae]
MAPSCHIVVTPPHQPREGVGDFQCETERLFAAEARAESPEEAAFSVMAPHSPSQSNCFLKSHSAYSLTKKW